MRTGYIREQLKVLPLVLVFLTFAVVNMFAPHIALGAVSGVLFLLAIGMVIEDHCLASRGRRAQGTIVDHKPQEDCFFPVVEFRDQKGILRQDTTRSGRGVKRPAIGSRVVVLYDPTGKNDSELDSFLRRFGMPLAVAFLGGMFAIGAILAQ